MPPADDDRPKGKVVPFWLPTDLVDLMDERAAETGVKRNRLAREALEAAFRPASSPT